MKGTVKVLRKDGNHGRGHSVIRRLDTAGQWFRRKSCKSLNAVNHPINVLWERNTRINPDKRNPSLICGFSYFLCAICPVKQDKPALRYLPSDGVFHERSPEWLASAPTLGFLFPLYEGGAADVNTILFFSKDCNDAHADFLKAAFNVEAEMPAAEQTENFQTLLAQSLGTECSLDVVQEMHEVVSGLIEEQAKDDEPLMLSKNDVARMLTDGGVSEDRVEAFQKDFDASLALARFFQQSMW